ncbi:Uncharacterized protein PRO82_000045 [Candidatus Protochlamydia amoebophila]|nr:Uncharacterized protein [Candidatus Protochlamydia amoebophila]
MLSVFCKRIKLLGCNNDLVEKEAGKTSSIKSFNNTFRQRCSLLMRKTPFFSQRLTNPIGMNNYFIYDYSIQ